MEEQKKETNVTSTEKVTDAEVVTPRVGQNTETAAPVAEKSSNKNPIFAFIAGILVAVIGYFVLQGGMPQQDAPVVEEIDPAAVVVRVNGEDLFGEALALQMLQIAQLNGVASISELEPGQYSQIKAQSVDAIVNSELIAQAAKEKGVEVSEDAIDAEYADLVEQIGGEEAAVARLKELGTTAEGFKNDLARDILIREFMLGEVGEFTVSEEEIESAYATITASMGEDVPALNDVRDQIRTQLEGEKQQVALQKVLEQLREDAEIEVLM